MIAFHGARIYPIEAPVIEEGVLLVEGGKVAAVGEAVSIPEEAEVFDVSGKVIMPGLVEAHCHLSIFDWGANQDFDGNGSESGRLAQAATPDFDYYYAFNPFSKQLVEARNSGVTTVLTRPGSGKVITGQGLVVKTAGKTRSDMVLLRSAGVKMAFGENPKRNFGRRSMIPSTRMGVAAVLREALSRAREYRQERKEAQEEDKPFKRNFQLEPLADLLEGRVKARIHAHRADDMQTALRIMDEFGFEASIEHASEGHKLVSQLVEHGVSCVVGPTLTFSSKVETVEKTFRTPGILQKAGIPVAVTTDAPVVPIDYLRTSAAMAHREGMSEEAALSSITQTAAEIAGVEERVGSLTPGKDADFQVLDGPPLELTSVVESVYINGGKVYDRQTYEEPWEKKLAAMHGS